MQKSVSCIFEFYRQQFHFEVKKPDDLACGAISILAWFLCVMRIWKANIRCRITFPPLRTCGARWNRQPSRPRCLPCRAAASTAPRLSALVTLSSSWAQSGQRSHLKTQTMAPTCILIIHACIINMQRASYADKSEHAGVDSPTWWWSGRSWPVWRRSWGPCKSAPSPWLLPGRPPRADGRSDLSRDNRKKRKACKYHPPLCQN